MGIKDIKFGYNLGKSKRYFLEANKRTLAGDSNKALNLLDKAKEKIENAKKYYPLKEGKKDLDKLSKAINKAEQLNINLLKK